jgi:hypothetical protein
MRLVGFGLFILCAFLLANAEPSRAQNFYYPCSLASLSRTDAGAPADITTTFGIGLDPATCGKFASAQDRPGEWLAGTLIDFTPPQWQVAGDADIPDGTQIGELKTKVALGILDNGCATVLNVNFKLLDATINPNDPVDALPDGTKDRLKPMAVEDENGIPAAATHWPSYLTTLAQATGMDLTKLRARFAGINLTDVVGTTVVANFLVFEPGAQLSNAARSDSRMGYGTVWILQDPLSPGSDQDPISDFCAPIWTERTLHGTADGTTYRGNPPDGSYQFVDYSTPLPDADNDGIENQLDPCPYSPNPYGWDPRAPLVHDYTVGDEDVDGLPSDCDPDSQQMSSCNANSGAAHHDEDCDGWANRFDNCALVANPDQADSDHDGIGDGCDQNSNVVAPSTVDGQHAGDCIASLVIIGAGGPNPIDPWALAPCCGYSAIAEPAAKVSGGLCGFGGFDADVDCDGDTDGLDLLAELNDVVNISTAECAYNEYTGVCDHTVDAADIVAFLRVLAGFPPPNPLPISSACPYTTPTPGPGG